MIYLCSYTTVEQSTCFLVNKGTKLPRWQSVALPYKRDTWIAVFVMALLVGPIFYALSRPRVTRYAHKDSISVMNFRKFNLNDFIGTVQYWVIARNQNFGVPKMGC